MIFHDKSRPICFWEEGHKDKVSTLFSICQGSMLSSWLITVNANLITWLREYLSAFSIIKLLFTLLSMLTLWKEVIKCSLQLKSGKLHSTSLRAEYQCKLWGIFLCRRLVSFPSLIYLFSMHAATFTIYSGL